MVPSQVAIVKRSSASCTEGWASADWQSEVLGRSVIGSSVTWTERELVPTYLKMMQSSPPKQVQASTTSAAPRSNSRSVSQVRLVLAV